MRSRGWVSPRRGEPAHGATGVVSFREGAFVARMSSLLPVLCLEDDPIVASAVRRAMPGREVDCVRRAAECRERMLQRSYGGWLLDIHVPDGSGLDVLEWGRSRGDGTRALIITGALQHELANRAQALGAEYLLKPFGKANLDAFLERCDAPLRTVPEELRVDTFVELYALTEREAEIVRAIARGVSRAGLSVELGISENTLKTAVRRLLWRTGHESLDDLLRSLLRGRAWTRPPRAR